LKVQTADGHKISYLVEVKPEASTKKPTPPKTKTTQALNNYKYAVETYIRNFHKTAAAKKYAKERGWKFIIVTEKFLK
jgi:hypothetical protein